MNFARRILFLLFFFASLSRSFAADIEPAIAAERAPALYEYGLGLGTARLPHYPGSDQSSAFVLPIPYFVYRGSVLRSDREEGTRARFFKAENFEVSLSGGGAIPVSSGGNHAREGMPDLGWIGEIGPKLSYRLFANSLETIRANVAVRGVFSATDLAWPKHLGSLLDLAIDYNRRQLFFDRLDLVLMASTIFVSEGVASYYYEVTPQFATPERPVYSAKAGYLYSTLSAGVSHELNEGKHKIYLGTAVDFLDRSANEASPLVREKVNTTVLIGYIYVLGRSEQRGE